VDIKKTPTQLSAYTLSVSACNLRTINIIIVSVRYTMVCCAVPDDGKKRICGYYVRVRANNVKYSWQRIWLSFNFVLLTVFLSWHVWFWTTVVKVHQSKGLPGTCHLGVAIWARLFWRNRLGAHRLGTWAFKCWDVWVPPFGHRTFRRCAALAPSSSFYILCSHCSP